MCGNIILNADLVHWMCSNYSIPQFTAVNIPYINNFGQNPVFNNMTTVQCKLDL